MKKIIDRLYVGTVADVGFTIQTSCEYSILGACKEPLHRTNARLSINNYDGYVGRAMPKDEPEYYYAEREHALYLNLIDAKEAAYIPDICINKALEFIEKEIAEGNNVLVVCNQGRSRSPAIAFLYLLKTGIIRCPTFQEAFNLFQDSFYKDFSPGAGILEYIKGYWEKLNQE